MIYNRYEQKRNAPHLNLLNIFVALKNNKKNICILFTILFCLRRPSEVFICQQGYWFSLNHQGWVLDCLHELVQSSCLRLFSSFLEHFHLKNQVVTELRLVVVVALPNHRVGPKIFMVLISSILRYLLI